MIQFDPHHRIDLKGRELLPEDLAWLSLTACQAQECRWMMESACETRP
ncbi:hypothetical protein [Stenotrophomonas sp. 1337]|nr:hypothetical protein [Stenotrophomonas sp. 1337]MDR6693117.1 hypothetical protein [Stenotrophomonas sp. 1337]